MQKVVMVTGSSRGIGKSIAETFLQNGHKVIINANKNRNELYETLHEFKFQKSKIKSENVMAFLADVSDYEQVKLMFAAAHEKFGRVDVLINNAGVSHVGLFQDMTPEVWHSIMQNNFDSVLNCSHFAIKDMLENRVGHIINISSIWGTCGASCETIYSASKAAVNLFTKSLAKELAMSNIIVNAVACGVIDTQMNEWLSDEERDKLLYDIPMNRFGMPNEISKLVCDLTSQTYLTGQIINIDGGML